MPNLEKCAAFLKTHKNPPCHPLVLLQCVSLFYVVSVADAAGRTDELFVFLCLLIDTGSTGSRGRASGFAAGCHGADPPLTLLLAVTVPIYP
jgi:hypothetical protein